MRAGEKLKTWRVGRGLSQSRAAEIADVRQGTWSDWESGKKTPHAHQIAKIEVMTDGEVSARCWTDLSTKEIARIEEAVRASAKTGTDD